MENKEPLVNPEEAMMSRAEIKAPGFSFTIEDLGWRELIALAMVLVFLYLVFI